MARYRRAGDRREAGESDDGKTTSTSETARSTPTFTRCSRPWGIYKNQRKATSQKRVFILSRSAFAGSQRFGVTAWSGDILSDWLSFRRQIPAGLNYEVSGLPYWTTDIGGFILGHPNNASYRELFVRWFEYGSFCPIFRVHGTRSPNVNELWSYGPKAESILTKFDRLRYRLLPYIYSMAWMVTSQNYTPMRPLVMDFRTDAKAQNIGNQFMFGPTILVNPVTEKGARSRARTIGVVCDRLSDARAGDETMRAHRGQTRSRRAPPRSA